jgi:uracil-DNA glycosylase
VFNAINLTPFSLVKVVIIGQDPYHGPGQAMGLSFSVPAGVRPPPSLVNIFKELADDLKLPRPLNGDLTPWAKNGVLLLNSVLTVEAGKPGSHQGKGWETFTDEIIKHLNNKEEPLVFILWGSPAQKKALTINTQKHLILKSVHPSPLSAYRGFFGNQHFSKSSEFIKQNRHTDFDWRI